MVNPTNIHIPYQILTFFFLWRFDPMRAMVSSLTRFLDHTQRRNTVGRTPLDEWSARRRDLYLTTHNTQNRQTSMPKVGFEPTFSAGERQQTYALDRTATGTGIDRHTCPPVGFEPTFSAGERPQTYALDRAATGTGCVGTGKCSPEDGLGKAETCNHTGVLMFVWFCCVYTEQNYFILSIKTQRVVFYLKIK